MDGDDPLWSVPDPIWDFVERWANWGAPLALLLLLGWPKNLKTGSADKIITIAALSNKLKTKGVLFKIKPPCAIYCGEVFKKY